MIRHLSAKLGNRFNDFYQDDLLVMVLEMFAFLTDHLRYTLDMAWRETSLPNAMLPESLSAMAVLVGYPFQGATPNTVELVGSVAGGAPSFLRLDSQTPFTVSVPSRAQPVRYTLMEEMGFLPGQIEARAMAAEGITQVDRFRSSGEPFQSLRGSVQGASLAFVTVLVNGRPWDRRASFYGARSEPVFRVSLERGYLTLHFGDDLTGHIPPKSAVIEVTYLIPTGPDTVISQGAINVTLPASNNPAVQIGVTNPEWSGGGAEPETVDQAREAIPGFTRAVNRMFAVDDVERLLLTYPGIRRARVVDIGRCPTRGIRPFQVSCFITLDTGQPASGKQLWEIQKWLAPQKNAGSQVVVQNAQEVVFHMIGRVVPESGRSKTEAGRAAYSRMEARFGELDIGESLSLSAVIALLHQVPEIQSVRLENDADFTVGDHQIAKLGSVVLT